MPAWICIQFWPWWLRPLENLEERKMKTWLRKAFAYEADWLLFFLIGLFVFTFFGLTIGPPLILPLLGYIRLGPIGVIAGVALYVVLGAGMFHLLALVNRSWEQSKSRTWRELFKSIWWGWILPLLVGTMLVAFYAYAKHENQN